jgi:hypothetical protein
MVNSKALSGAKVRSVAILKNKRRSQENERKGNL